MTHRHHHHHHHHGGQQPHMGAETGANLKKSALGEETRLSHEQQHVEINQSNAPQTDAEETSLHQFGNTDTDQGLFRRDTEVTQTVTAVVATAIDVIIEDGSQTIAQITVTSLPAVVSIPALGVVTIPADSNSPTAAVAAAATAGPQQQIHLGSSATSILSTVLTTQGSSSTQSTQTTPPGSSSSTSSPTTAVSISSTQSDTSSSSSSSLSSKTASLTSSESSTTPSSSIASSTTSFTSTTFLIGSSTSTSVTSPANSGYSITNSVPYSSSTSTSSAATSSGGGSDTGKIVGGVVGGVLGFLAILILIFLLLKWRRKHTQSATGATDASSRDVQGSSEPRSSEMMSQRSSNTPLAAAAVLGRWTSSSSRRSVRQENPFMAPGERGFQKISGRKIPSVLQTGGDGYGDEIEEEPIPEIRTPPLEATSPVSPVSAIGGSHRYAPMQDDSIAPGVVAGAFVLRPSPARTPTASSVDLAAQSQSGQYGTFSTRPDPLGRTLARHDGSRSSRFTEGI